MKGFFQSNKAVSLRIKKLFRHTDYNIFHDYDRVVESYFNKMDSRREKPVILDVGGGKSCTFAQRAFRDKAYIVAMDISESELSLNDVADRKICADVTKAMPYPEGLDAPGILCSKCVMEHLADNESFIRLAAETQDTGGFFIALIPNKFAPFALINQMLGEKMGRAVLRFTGKKSAYNGFKAYYNKTYPSAVAKLLCANGYHIAEQRFSYHAAAYFDFFFPLFFLCCMYECIVSRLRLHNLCSYFIVVASRDATLSEPFPA